MPAERRAFLLTDGDSCSALVLVSLWLLTWLLVRLLVGLLARFRILPLALLLFALLLLALLLRRVLVVLLVHDRASSPRSQADRRAGGRCRENDPPRTAVAGPPRMEYPAILASCRQWPVRPSGYPHKSRR